MHLIAKRFTKRRNSGPELRNIPPEFFRKKIPPEFTKRLNVHERP